MSMVTKFQPLTAMLRIQAARMYATGSSLFSSALIVFDSFFAPISQIRFWGIQVIAVATPGALFVVYTIQT